MQRNIETNIYIIISACLRSYTEDCRFHVFFFFLHQSRFPILIKCWFNTGRFCCLLLLLLFFNYKFMYTAVQSESLAILIMGYWKKVKKKKRQNCCFRPITRFVKDRVRSRPYKLMYVVVVTIRITQPFVAIIPWVWHMTTAAP